MAWAIPPWIWPSDEHRGAAVVDRHVAHQAHLPGLHVDPGHAGVRTEREHEALRVVERGLLQARLDIGRELLGRDVRGARDLGHRHPFVGRAAHLELFPDQLEVLGRGLEQGRADALGLLLHLLGRPRDRLAADRQRA